MTVLAFPRLVSVIMPNYNYGRFIAQAIDSVIQQDYRPIELIVVDDGSTDDSLERIAAALERPHELARAEVISFPENRGKIAAMNRGIELASGEYSIILDADDFLSKSYVSRCVAELEKAREEDETIGFVYTDCNLISEHGDYLERGRSTAFDPALIERFSFIPEPAVVLTEALKSCWPYDESIRRGTKHHKWRRIIDAGWMGRHLPEPLFYYRMHGGNLSGIGNRVLGEIRGGHQGERILSGYWPTQAR